ncbi:MAG: response regulator, partial [Gammaproteobacteria bacterium]|nr:response regulator [Gammaproteobacteria bacterium]
LLLVEDDELLGNGLHVGLQPSGYAVDWVKDVQSAELFLGAGAYDLMILDIGLPRRSGLEVLRALRGGGGTLPVLMLTARDTVEDKVSGLDSGADDYLVKPFDLDELAARIRALLRRRSGRSEPVIRHHDIILDPASHAVTRAGHPVDLAPREFAVLQQLLENRGRVLSRTQLEQNLYSWKDEVDSNAVEVHIHHLRKKLWPELIRTIRGVGYVIDKEV